MSVAFRRESDEEHKEPRFELPIPPGPNLVTSRGLQAIGEKLASIDEKLAGAADPAEIEALRRERRYWGTRQATAQIAPIPAGDEVAFGTRVSLKMAGAVRSIDIVGNDEANPAGGRIAFTAPLARTILGSITGEICEFGGEEGAIEILGVAAIPEV